MAAMLLIGTNAWAENEFQTGSFSSESLQEAIDNAADGAVVKVIAFDDPITYHVRLNANKHIVLDLNGKELQFNCTDVNDNVAIAVIKGILEITGGGNIKNISAKTYDLIRVYGTLTDIDAKTETPYAQVIVKSGVTLYNSTKNVLSIDVMRPDQASLIGLTATQYTNQIGYTCVVNNHAKKYGLAKGARIDVYGALEAGKYGIKVNGMVRDPQEFNENREFSPYIYIDHNATVATNSTAKEAVAIYSSGYARWRVEGTCQGSTGLYAKSGNIELVDATIQSMNGEASKPALGKGAGVEAGGSAIVVESNPTFSGGIQITVAGNTQVIATAGYAIEETVDTDDDTKVENITVVSGTIQGGEAGAIIVTQKTVQDPDADVVIVGGTITSENNSDPLQIEGSSASEQAVINTLIPGGYDGQKPSSQPQGGGTHKIDIKTGYYATLNAAGLATFSAEERTLIPTGLKAYAAGELNGEELTLEKVTGAYIPANTGVILFADGQAHEGFTLAINTEGTESAAFPSTNNLYPSTTFATRPAGIAYILHDDLLYEYVGTVFPANKAYLQFNGSGAPQRIRMVFHETEEEQQTEAISNVEAASVKAVKFVENGEILIRRGENVYNLQGQIVK